MVCWSSGPANEATTTPCASMKKVTGGAKTPKSYASPLTIWPTG